MSSTNQCLGRLPPVERVLISVVFPSKWKGNRLGVPNKELVTIGWMMRRNRVNTKAASLQGRNFTILYTTYRVELREPEAFSLPMVLLKD